MISSVSIDSGRAFIGRVTATRHSIKRAAWLFVVLLFPAFVQAGATSKIAELYLFPRERVTDKTRDAYREVLTNIAWSKFDKVCVYGALPSQAELFAELMRTLNEFSRLQGRPMAYQASTIGPEGWEQITWSQSGFWERYGPQIPSSFLAVDVESLKLRHSGPPAERAAKVGAYLKDFIRVADAKHAQKEVWYTGSWDQFPWSGDAVPLLFTADLVAQLDRVHWMDLPKLLSKGDETAFRKQLEKLLAVTGPTKTFLQVGVLNDLDVAANAARARKMMTIAQEMGINRFTVYVKLGQIHEAGFRDFYAGLEK